jgi:hypothetical protein
MIELVDCLIGCYDRPSFYWTISIILRTAMALMYSFRITRSMTVSQKLGSFTTLERVPPGATFHQLL